LPKLEDILGGRFLMLFCLFLRNAVCDTSLCKGNKSSHVKWEMWKMGLGTSAADDVTQVETRAIMFVSMVNHAVYLMWRETKSNSCNGLWKHSLSLAHRHFIMQLKKVSFFAGKGNVLHVFWKPKCMLHYFQPFWNTTTHQIHLFS